MTSTSTTAYSGTANNNAPPRGSRSLPRSSMPVRSFHQFTRMLDFANGEIPDAVMAEFQRHQHDTASMREIGINIATRVSEEVLDAGAEGLHFYTLNTASSTLEVIKRLGVRASTIL